jgi:hypothetical protein
VEAEIRMMLVVEFCIIR